MVIEEGRSRNYWHFKETPLHEFTESRECDDSSAQSDQLERCGTKSRRTLLFCNNFSLISYREVLIHYQRKCFPPTMFPGPLSKAGGKYLNSPPQVRPPFCIICIRIEDGDHHSRMLLMIYAFPSIMQSSHFGIYYF